MPDTTSDLVTNFGVAGNLDAMRDGRGDDAASHAFLRTMYEFESEHATQRDAIGPRIGDLLREYRSEKSRLLSEDRLAKRARLLSRRRRQLRELAEGAGADARQIMEFQRDTRRRAEAIISRADVQVLEELRTSVAGNLVKLVHGDHQLPVGEPLDEGYSRGRSQ